MHEYLPSKEYTEEFNKGTHGLKIYRWCSVCHEHEPCKHNEGIGQRLLNAGSGRPTVLGDGE